MLIKMFRKLLKILQITRIKYMIYIFIVQKVVQKCNIFKALPRHLTHI